MTAVTLLGYTNREAGRTLRTAQWTRSTQNFECYQVIGLLVPVSSEGR